MNPAPSSLISLNDYAAAAKARLTPNAQAYLEGGAEDEWALQKNLASWQAWDIIPRVLRDLSGGHTRVRILGRDHAAPLLIAPTAFHKLAHPDGEIATLLGTAAMGAGFVLSSQSTVSLEELGLLRRQLAAEQAAPPFWFQLYIQPDREFTWDLASRAEAAGCEAIVLTVDAPVSGARDRERKAGFHLPAGLSPVNLAGLKSAVAHASAGQSALFGPSGLLASAPTWEDLTRLLDRTQLPVLIKGVLSAADAMEAKQRGAAGVIVSNHGGRTLDSLPAPATVLPEIREATGADFTVLVDGGVRRGADLLKAIALGADAALIGRPALHGLAVNGASGVAHVLSILRQEFEIALALSGCASPAEVTGALLKPASFPLPGPFPARPDGMPVASRALSGD